MAQRIRFDAQKLQHDNYATSTTAAVKTLPANVTAILIENMDASISVAVSFDGGTTYKTIVAGRSLSLDVDRMVSYKVKSASGTPSVEALYGYEG